MSHIFVAYYKTPMTSGQDGNVSASVSQPVNEGQRDL